MRAGSNVWLTHIELETGVRPIIPIVAGSNIGAVNGVSCTQKLPTACNSVQVNVNAVESGPSYGRPIEGPAGYAKYRTGVPIYPNRLARRSIGSVHNGA